MSNTTKQSPTSDTRDISALLETINRLAIAALGESLNERASGRLPPSRIVDRAGSVYDG